MQIKQFDLSSGKLLSMKKHYACFVVLVLIAFKPISAQVERTKNWYFGQNVALQLNDTLFPTLLSNSQISTPGGCASISDTSGQLLFYTNGETIWNGNNNVMINGSGLAGNGNASQSSLIVPDPGNSNQYYVFTIDASCSNILHYSIVDMSMVGGLGAVTQSNIALDSNMIQKITGMANSTSNGYWVITHNDLGTSFYAYPVTSSGVGVPVISNTGTVVSAGNCTGVLKASPKGNRLAMTYPALNGFELYGFDNSTGIVYNAMFIGNTLTDATFGCEFSPNGNYIYCNAVTAGITPPTIYQFDATLASAASIDSSKIQVGFSQNPFVYTSMQLGLDGKIYCAGTNRDYISFIQQPDNAGFACNYVENAFYLGGNVTQNGLPNFINTYFSSLTSTKNENSTDYFSLYPNPTKDFLVVEINNSINFTVDIFDLAGKQVTLKEEKFRRGKKFDFNSLKSGIYFLKLHTENMTTTKKIIVVK